MDDSSVYLPRGELAVNLGNVDLVLEPRLQLNLDQVFS